MLRQLAEEVVSVALRPLQPVIDEVRRARWRRLDPWREGNRSEFEQTAFKTALLEFYQCSSPVKVRDKPMAICMVSQKEFPQPLVIASHIWKHASQGFGLDEFGLKMADLNSPRNGLLLASEIEAAFNIKRVTFSYNLLRDKFTFHVLDSSLLDTPIHNHRNNKTASFLFSYYGEPKDSKVTCTDPVESGVDSATSTPAPKPQRSVVEEIASTFPTFRQFDNKELPWCAPALPFRRLLAWHYAVATTTAQRCSWFKPEHSLPKCATGKSEWSQHLSGVLWPTDDLLDLFDHAMSKSQRDDDDAEAASSVEA